MKYLISLTLCTAAAAHAGIPVVGGPTLQWPNPEQLQQLAQQHLLVAQQYQQLAQAQQAQQAQQDRPQLKNEAVRVLPGGKRIVEEPPGPKSLRKLPTGPSFFIGGTAPSYVIDSNGGLKECGWPWLSQGCRDYRPGAEQRPRGWVVKSGGQWLKCPRRDSRSGCVDYYAPPPQMPVQE
ncbi:hypothetical protein [Azohydromonas australica]|uniref:hypothetical protein n=1 Tax=Azohydromonas australica TaxID=364039 RepID=UPI000426AF04|nr:hypothetical protein [Azohydromonas australica]